MGHASRRWTRILRSVLKHLLYVCLCTGVIVFGSDQEVAGVMRAVARGGALGVFSWVGSDGWSARALVSAGNERAVAGTISVQPQANEVRGFRDYFLSLTVENNKRNPWFVGEHISRAIDPFCSSLPTLSKLVYVSEFWEDHFRCRYPGSALTPYNGNYTRGCTGLERLTSNNTQFEAQLQFVSDAVMAFVYALR